MAWPNGKPPEGRKWKKGQSGNPGGRPSIPKLGRALGMRLRERALENDGYLGEMVITQLFKKARKGDLKAIQIVLEYLEGKPAQTLNLNSTEPQKVQDIDQRITDIVKRAVAREDDTRGKGPASGVAGDQGKNSSVQ